MSTKRVKVKKRRRAAALLILLALFVAASGVTRLYFRSSNALDELYYATVDSRCGEALSYNLVTTDSLISFVSPIKGVAVDYMAGVESWHGGYYATVNGSPVKHALFGIGQYSDLEATYSDATRYRCDSELLNEELGLESLGWAIEDCLLIGQDCKDESKPKGILFQIEFQLSKYSSEYALSPMTAEVNFVYDVNKKRIALEDDGGFCVWESGSSSAVSRPIGYLRDRGISPEEVTNDALQVVKGLLLPRFLSRGGAMSRFSPDFEQDGVTVDIDLSSS